MKAVRVPVASIVLSLGVLGLVLVSRPASAQCINDPPTGTILITRCITEGMRSSPSAGRISSGIDGGMMLRFPVVSAVTWWISRQPMQTLSARNPLHTSGGEAIRPDGVRRRSGF